jgi:RNA polymerase sigma factor (sigma-70 family)
MGGQEAAHVAERESDSATIVASLADPDRFAAIFDRHFDGVHRYLARRASAALADDVASGTFVLAFERRQSFRAESTSARPWLLGIATNLLRERWRAERRELGTALRLSAVPTPAVGAAAEMQTGVLAAALAALEAPQRDVLLLYAWEELSYEEISHALQIPIGTVRSRLARARSHTRARLEGADHDHQEQT